MKPEISLQHKGSEEIARSGQVELDAPKKKAVKKSHIEEQLQSFQCIGTHSSLFICLDPSTVHMVPSPVPDGPRDLPASLRIRPESQKLQNDLSE